MTSKLIREFEWMLCMRMVSWRHRLRIALVKVLARLKHFASFQRELTGVLVNLDDCILGGTLNQLMLAMRAKLVDSFPALHLVQRRGLVCALKNCFALTWMVEQPL